MNGPKDPCVTFPSYYQPEHGVFPHRSYERLFLLPPLKSYLDPFGNPYLLRSKNDVVRKYLKAYENVLGIGC